MGRRPGTRRRGRAAVGIAALGVAACGSGSAEPPPRAEPFMVLPPLAGVSSRTIEVDPVRPGDFGADTTGAVWHRFQHRCAGCHAAPSPTLHSGLEWPRVVDRMSENIDSAGLLPLSDRDAAAVTELLQRHARGVPGERP